MDQLSSTVAAASTYVGSLWGGWNSSSASKKEKDERSIDKSQKSTKLMVVNVNSDLDQL